MDRAVRALSPAPRQAWEQLVAADPTATVYQTPAWLDAICAVGPYQDASRLYETTNGRQFVLPMVRRARLPGFEVVASPPRLWGYGGLVAPRSTTADDVAAVWANLATQPVTYGKIRPHYLAAAAWDAVSVPSAVTVGRSVTHVLDLDGGFERVWRVRFKTAVRGAIRKAERSGLEVESGSGELLAPIYHELYLRWVTRRAQERRLPAGVQRWRANRKESPVKHQVVARLLGDACRIYVARLDGKPVAALVLLVDGVYSHYWRGYSDKALAGPTRANNLLQRLAIEDACRAGCRWYDMGESGGVTSLMRFKAAHGAEPREFPLFKFGRGAVVRARGWSADAGQRVRQLAAGTRRR